MTSCRVAYDGSTYGVILPYFEWVQATQHLMEPREEINRRRHHILQEGLHRALHRSKKERLDIRTAHSIEGIDRVSQTKMLREIFPSSRGPMIPNCDS